MFLFLVVNHLSVSLWRRSRTDQQGQASAEYALVLLAAAAIALLVGVWAVKSDAIGKLFDAVMNSVIGKVT